MVRKTTPDAFLQKAVDTHGDRYLYTNVVYVNTHTKVEIICRDHGSFAQTPVNHIRGQGCPKCKHTNIKKTLESKYGVDNPMKLSAVVNKQRQTMVERYGVPHAVQSPLLKRKIQSTNRSRYGVDTPLQSPSILKQTKDTMVDKYGTEHPAQVESIQSRIKTTNIIRYGSARFIHSQEGRDVITKTSMEKYGVVHPSQSVTIRQKIQQSNATSNKETSNFGMLDDRDWVYDQYVTQGKRLSDIGAVIGVVGSTVGRYIRKHNITVRVQPAFSVKSILWFESITKDQNIHIQHALNGGEYQIPGTRYFADGFCAETNTIYEFYGDYWHGNPTKYSPTTYNVTLCCTMGELFNKTIEREKQIKDLGYTLVIIWESDFVECLSPADRSEKKGLTQDLFFSTT